jgi:hypothetical protein
MSAKCHYRTHALQHSGVTRSPHRRFRAKIRYAVHVGSKELDAYHETFSP